ncbi:MAG: WG repeat-containing protein [Bacteroidota bacterium]
MHPLLLLCILALNLSFELNAQKALPVRENGRWGVINDQGQLLISPQYDLLGWPGAGSSLVVQQAGLLGLIGPDGQQLLPTRYDDIQILDEQLFALLDNSQWSVRNLAGETVVPPGYEQLRRLGPGLIAYRQQTKWGLARADGRQIAAPVYDRIDLLDDNRILVKDEGRFGILQADGLSLLQPSAENFEIDSSHQFLFFRSNGRWGGKPLTGGSGFPAEFENYSWLDDHHLLLVDGDRISVYSTICQQRRQLPMGARPISFTDRMVAFRLGNRVGLLSDCDNTSLPAEFLELQPFSRHLLRARKASGWGLVSLTNEQILAFDFDYISPLGDGLALVFQGGKVGLVNAEGRLVQAAEYARIEQEGDRWQAYNSLENGARVTTLILEEDGSLRESAASSQHFRVQVAGRSPASSTTGVRQSTMATRILPQHEWFYAADQDRWGLRLRGGREVLPPTFSRIEVDRELGITLVGLNKTTEIAFERTTYRANEVFGLLLNDEGKVVTELNLLHLELADWHAGNPLARCIFENGRFGLIDRLGRIVVRDAAYIGDFDEGLAPISLRGRLSGTLEAAANQDMPLLKDFLRSWQSSVVLKDYTTYDQQFARSARLSCIACIWGYIDNSGQQRISNRFTEPVGAFRQGRAIVRVDNQQGLIDYEGRFVIEPHYEIIEPMLNGNGKLVYRLMEASNRVGLIDTMGRERLAANYRAKGEAVGDWVPVQSQYNWGYYNLKDNRQLADNYLMAGPFNEGLAAVQLPAGWSLINEAGDQVWEAPYYDYLGNVSQGTLWARTAAQWSLVDTSGSTRFTLEEADEAFDFEGQIARVVVEDKVGLVNREGAWVLRPRYPRIDPFQANGRARVRLTGNPERYGIIDTNGRLLTTKAYRSIEVFSDGLALVQDQNGYGFIDASGQEVIACQLGPTRSFSEGLAVFQEFGRCGYIDQQGREVVPPRYSNCLDFNGGLAVVYQTMSNAGLIDQSGAEVVEPSLNRLLHFQEGRGLVKDRERGYYFVAQNASLYDGYYDYARPYQFGVAIVGQQDGVGLINHKGIPLIRPKYAAISDFSNGLATVRVDQLYGLADADGRLILPVAYDYLAPASDQSLRVERGNALGYLDFDGKWLWELRE